MSKYYTVRYCPKCGSTNVNSGYIGPLEGREYWCEDCKHVQYRPFSKHPPKRLARGYIKK